MSIHVFQTKNRSQSHHGIESLTWPLFLPFIIYSFGFITLIGSVLVKYNPVNSTLFILLAFSLLGSISYYTLIKQLRHRNLLAFYFLIAICVVHITFGTLGIALTIPISLLNGNINELIAVHLLKGAIGISILSLVVYSPLLSFFGINKKRHMFEQKMGKVSKFVWILGYSFVSIINLFWLGFFTYLFLVFLFPIQFGIGGNG